MTTVHRTVLETTPDEAFVRLTAALAGDRELRPWHVGQRVRLPQVEDAADCRVTALERPNVVVLEHDGQVRHSIVVAPAVGGGAEVVWTTAGCGQDDPVTAAIGDVVLRDLTMADPVLRTAPAGEATPSPAANRTAGLATVLDHVVLDHQYLETQLDRVCALDLAPDVSVVTALLADIARHEAAESALLRPRLRTTVGGPPVAATLDRQQREIARRCHEVIEAALADAPELAALLRCLRETVLAHCATEEAVEHPRLQGACTAEVLEDLGRSYLSMTRVEIDLREADPVLADRAGRASA